MFLAPLGHRICELSDEGGLLRYHCLQFVDLSGEKLTIYRCSWWYLPRKAPKRSSLMPAYPPTMRFISRSYFSNKRSLQIVRLDC
jgi:hypothetical protein